MGDKPAKETVELARRLELAWQSGEIPDLSRFVPPEGSPNWAATLVELVKVDQQYRWRGGEPSHLERYLERWPVLHDHREAVSKLLESECKIRAALGDQPTEDELRQRFPTLFEDIDLQTVPHGSHGGGSDSHAPGDRSDLPVRSSFDTTPVSGDSQPTPHPSWRLTPTGGKVGRYEIRALLGTGGMGEVYRAYDAQLQREVALKIPRVVPGAKPEVLGRFVQEALAAASLRHPNICPVYDAGQIEDRYYIVMALIEGNNLADELKEGRIGTDRAVRITAQLARALETAHEAGIIHRDIKPANVLIDRADQPLLTDFGLAHRMDDEEQRAAARALMGTPAYMSPEQAELKPLDRRTDIYSLGVVLYQLLAGRLPYPGPPSQFLRQIVKGQMPRLRTQNPDVDPRLEAVCHKAMARDPRDRYQSAAELAAALEAFAQPAVTTAGLGKQVVWLAALGLVLIALIPLGRSIIVGSRGGDRAEPGKTGGPVSAKRRDESSRPPTRRERQIAELQTRIDALAPAIGVMEEVRELEADYCETRSSVFGMNSPAVSRKITAALTRLRTYELSEKELELGRKADEILANTSIFAVPEEAYLLVREMAEMVDARLARLRSRQEMLRAHAEVLDEEAPPEQVGTTDERDWRVRETRRKLAGLGGADLVASELRKLDERFFDVQQQFKIGGSPALAVTTHVLLARIYILDLTPHELELHSTALAAATRLGAFSLPDDAFLPTLQVARAVNQRRWFYQYKLDALNSWTPGTDRYQELIEMRPRTVQFQCDRARILALYGQHDEALELLTQLISRAPDDVVLRTLRAEIYIDDEQYLPARREVTRIIIARHDQFAYGHYLSGYLHAEQGDDELAIDACGKALQLDPELVPAYLTRARAYNRIGTYALALKDCNEAIRLAPWVAEPYRVRTLASVGLGKYDPAYEDALQANQLDPLAADGHFVLANALFHKEQYEQAGRHLTMAILADSTVSDYYRLRAACGDKLGYVLRAAADRARVKQMERDEARASEPDSPTAAKQTP